MGFCDNNAHPSILAFLCLGLSNNLTDSIKEIRKNNDKAFTFNGNTNRKSSRIDYILTPRRILSSINDYELINGIALNSDHNLTKININKRLKPKSQNNFFKAEFLSDPNLKS